MSACISSHGEYDAHETDPDTFACKWCHEFDETGAMAEIARLRRGPVTGMEHAIEQAAQASYAHRQSVGDFPDGLTDWGDLPESWRDEWREAGEHVVRALADAGLLAPAPLREEWSAAFTAVSPDGTRRIERIGTPGSREHAQETCDDCNADDPEVLFFLVRSHYTDWLPDRGEGDGRVDR